LTFRRADNHILVITSPNESLRHFQVFTK